MHLYYGDPVVLLQEKGLWNEYRLIPSVLQKINEHFAVAQNVLIHKKLNRHLYKLIIIHIFIKNDKLDVKFKQFMLYLC